MQQVREVTRRSVMGEGLTRVGKSPGKSHWECCPGFDGPATQALLVLQEVLGLFSSLCETPLPMSALMAPARQRMENRVGRGSGGQRPERVSCSISIDVKAVVLSSGLRRDHDQSHCVSVQWDDDDDDDTQRSPSNSR